MSIILLSILVMGASMSAMVLAVVIAGRPLGGGCAGAARECGTSVECEGCPRSRAALETSRTSEVQP